MLKNPFTGNLCHCAPDYSQIPADFCQPRMDANERKYYDMLTNCPGFRSGHAIAALSDCFFLIDASTELIRVHSR
ncbi:MAG: hypothetical protein B6245_21450 [Desulfobacteraceae bacterium 4572_88]|nr:MAG: hypothetical protein B6245_21450 [Desulfobacteraceae bacterium 4572_88]